MDTQKKEKSVRQPKKEKSMEKEKSVRQPKKEKSVEKEKSVRQPKRKKRHYGLVPIKKLLDLLEQVHPEMSLTENAKMYLINLLQSVLDKFMYTINSLLLRNKIKTVSDRYVKSAAKIILTGELRENALKESQGELVFPEARIKKAMRKCLYNDFSRMSGPSSVWMTRVLEYLCAEILELSGNIAKDKKKVRITSAFIAESIQNDTELRQLFCNSVLSSKA